MKKNKEEKNIVKNYFILFLVCFFTFLVVLYIARWHKVYTDYQKEIPIIRGALSYEITAQDFDHYITESPTAVIYMCTSSSDACRSFEKDFKKVIVKKNLQNSIIYLNLSDADIDQFVNDFNTKYNYKIKLTKDYPAIVEFVDGKVTALLEGNESNPLTISRVNQFISINNVGEESTE